MGPNQHLFQLIFSFKSSFLGNNFELTDWVSPEGGAGGNSIALQISFCKKIDSSSCYILTRAIGAKRKAAIKIFILESKSSSTQVEMKKMSC